MFVRKYNSYEIRLTFLNGKVETIHKEFSNSYKTMIRLYSQIKNKYSKDGANVRIDFVGHAEFNELKILFSKSIINLEDYRIKQNADEIRDTSTQSLVGQMLELNCKLNKRKEYVNGQVDVLSKKRDNTLHEILIKGEECRQEEKINYFDTIYELTKNRHEYNTEKLLINEIKINSHIQSMKDVLNHRISTIESSRLLHKEKFSELLFVKNYPYQNYRQRDNLMKQLNHKYDRVIDNESEMCINVYNKCGSDRSITNLKKVAKENKTLEINN